MQDRPPNDPADTIVLPKDELAARRAAKQAGGLSRQQVLRLLKAAAERKSLR